MKFTEVRLQLEQIFTRAIETGISVKQNFPAINEDALLTIGSLKSTTIALKNTPYKDIYNELESNDQYHIKLPDGGLLLFQYTFENQDTLLKHRLGYFPSPSLPSMEECVLSLSSSRPLLNIINYQHINSLIEIDEIIDRILQ